MEKLNKVRYIAERDIDLLLLEEINVNTAFATWLYERVALDNSTTPICRGAWHSVTRPKFGESDLIVIYESGLAILIENKIDAQAQPEQSSRYIQRGEAGIDGERWNRFVTCVVAPERYLRINSEAEHYDVKITYEQIEDWFIDRNTERANYKAYLLNEAIEQQRRGYSPEPDENVTQFWLEYWSLARRKFPSLQMSDPGIKPSNSDWPDFRPAVLGNQLNIVHKMAQGFVDLQVRGALERLDEIRELVDCPDLLVVAAGKSTAVRIEVGAVDRFGSFEGQRETMEEALNAAVRLLEIAKRLRDRL